MMLSEYRLSAATYRARWMVHQERIFPGSTRAADRPWLPDSVFPRGFEHVVLWSGGHFTEEQYAALTEAVRALGETHWLVVDPRGPDHPKFKAYAFPAEMRWDDFAFSGTNRELNPTVPIYSATGSVDWDRHIEASPHQIMSATWPDYYYVFGARADWGVCSETFAFDVAVIGAQGEALDVMRACVEDERDDYRTYINAPMMRETFTRHRPNWVEAFERNYLAPPERDAGSST